MQKIELHDAFIWDCNECGRENVQRAVARQVEIDDPDEVALVRQELGLEPDEALPEDLGLMVSFPAKVVCRHCETEYEPYCHDDTEDDEEDE